MIELEEVNIGRKWWNDFIAREQPDAMDCVMFFPEKDSELNTEAIRILETYMEELHVKRLFIYYSDQAIDVEIPANDRIYKEQITENTMNSIMRLLALWKISNRVTIISLKQPEGRRGENAIHGGYVTLSQTVKYGLLGLNK
jgi:hypothetical protein